jgi:hypothetical protein
LGYSRASSSSARSASDESKVDNDGESDDAGDATPLDEELEAEARLCTGTYKPDDGSGSKDEFASRV